MFRCTLLKRISAPARGPGQSEALRSKLRSVPQSQLLSLGFQQAEAVWLSLEVRALCGINEMNSPFGLRFSARGDTSARQ